MNNHFSALLILCALVSMTSCNNLEHKVEPLMQNKWEIGPFVKQDADNPILIPDPSLVFVDPVS